MFFAVDLLNFIELSLVGLFILEIDIIQFLMKESICFYPLLKICGFSSTKGQKQLLHFFLLAFSVAIFQFLPSFRLLFYEIWAVQSQVLGKILTVLKTKILIQTLIFPFVRIEFMFIIILDHSELKV